MKTISAVLLLFFIAAAQAQAAHEVDISYVASLDCTTANPGTTTIYRAPAACPVAGIPTGGVAIASNQPTGFLPTAPYPDKTVTSGTWCYWATATINSATSGASLTGNAVISISPVTSFVTVVVK